MPFIAKEHHLQAHSRKHEGLNHCRDAQPVMLESARGQEKSKAARTRCGENNQGDKCYSAGSTTPAALRFLALGLGFGCGQELVSL